jgi:hypothetical protein
VLSSLLFAELTGYRRDSLIVSSTPPQPTTPPSFTLDLATRICATLREPGKEAVSLAESLSGTSPSISLSWVSPVVLEAPSHFPEEEDAWPLESGAAEAEEVDVVEQALDRNVVLEDYFAEDPAISHEDVEDVDPQTPSFSPLIPII